MSLPDLWRLYVAALFVVIVGIVFGPGEAHERAVAVEGISGVDAWLTLCYGYYGYGCHSAAGDAVYGVEHGAHRGSGINGVVDDEHAAGAADCLADIVVVGDGHRLCATPGEHTGLGDAHHIARPQRHTAG